MSLLFFFLFDESKLRNPIKMFLAYMMALFYLGQEENTLSECEGLKDRVSLSCALGKHPPTVGACSIIEGNECICSMPHRQHTGRTYIQSSEMLMRQAWQQSQQREI